MKSKSYALDAGSIEPILDEIGQELTGWKVERRNMLRIRLTLEELLSRLLEFDGRPETVSLFSGKRFGQKVICLQYDGAPFNPTQSGDPDDWGARILDRLGLSPFWSYRGMKNRVELRVPRTSGRSMLCSIVISLVCAFLVGALGRLLPDSFTKSVTDLLLTPVLDLFLRLLNTFAGVMIAFTILTGILGIGDASTLNRLGKYVLLRFFIITFIVSAFTLASAAPFFQLRISGAAEGGESQAEQIVQMLVNILPKNLIEPFSTANTMQIILLAMIIGGILLTIREKAPGACRLVNECATLTQTIMSFVCRLVPIFIFASLLRQIWSGNAEALLSLWKPLCLYLAVLLIVTFAALLITSLRLRISPVLLLRKLFPPFLVALSTASSMSAYSLSVDTCKTKLGIDASLVDFAFPIGIVLYMPGGVITFAVLSGYLADLYHIGIGLPWLLMAWLLCAILSVAVPPIPGAMLTCYGILLAQLGIPPEGLLLAAAFDVIQDFLSSGFDVLLLQLELARQAVPLGKLDPKALERQSAP